MNYIFISSSRTGQRNRKFWKNCRKLHFNDFKFFFPYLEGKDTQHVQEKEKNENNRKLLAFLQFFHNLMFRRPVLEL